MRSGRVADRLEQRGNSAATLRDLMHTSVVSAAPDTAVAEAAAAMVRAKAGSAVVMQGSFLAGILTERDVLRAAASGEDLSRSLVSEWMTPDPQSESLCVHRGCGADHAPERISPPAGGGGP